MNPTEQYAEIRAIADAICDNTATQEQVEALEQRLKGDQDAQRFFYDYMSMHVHLKSAADIHLEFVYRRMTEEFIIRGKEVSSKEHIQEARNNGAKPPSFIEQVTDESSSKTKPWLKVLLIGFGVSILLWLLLDQYFIKQAPPAHVAEISTGHVSIVELGQVQGRYLSIGEYQTTQATSLLLVDGTSVEFAPHSRFKLFNTTELSLKSGGVSIQPATEQSKNSANLIVHGPTFSLYSNGGPLSLNLSPTHPLLTTSDNTFLLPNRWRPIHYWPFENQTELVTDSAGTSHGKPASGATRVKGLLGAGAFYFDNSADARIDVGSGGGTAPATGSFAVTDGVTIEALIQPEFSGELGELDEIFRKDQDDREFRMLLSFQNDRGKDNLYPAGNYKESLSFGLYLIGQGYHELKLALDGINGRPSLAQLKDDQPHHVVATYDVQSGHKAIYIDGKQLAFYQYPPGSKMITGGTGKASIGNIPNQSRWDMEAFAGIIDEVAFYDYAMPPFMVQRHLNQVQQGYNYFGLRPSNSALPEQIKIPLPPHTSIRLNPLTGLPQKVFEE